ncbi:MAG: hypothetical protein GY853_15890 [PVC group bacterium]|nr:hypothetical protein [PVC group bacterium]
MTYSELKNMTQKEVDEFPLRFAFNDEQFQELLNDFGIEMSEVKDKLVSLGYGGGFMRKTDVQSFNDMAIRHEKRLEDAKKDDSFLIDAIEYELGNHEYCITYDETDTVDVLDLDLEDLRVVKCFQIARKNYLNSGVCD